MADFSYTGKGGFEIFGCSENTVNYFVETLFIPGEFAWIKQKARKGVVERVFIKKINQISWVGFNYQDSLNRLWLEVELCLEADAIALAVSHLEQQQQALITALKNCQ